MDGLPHGGNAPKSSGQPQSGDLDMTEQNNEHGTLLSLTSQIVAAHVSNNAVANTDLPQLIETVFHTLSGLDGTPAEPEPEQKPAVPIKKSINDDFLICLEDGKKLKMLKRHLSTAYGMTPEEYRAKWGLPHDYPMVAPNYSKTRKDLAKKIGLGRKPKSA
ncbi:MucR family transcriptional regulator [Paralimibaculum aggregatum]|uniref:MucR family transcriptional regulator n=2 Tax=Paralimibaculum aggregatum TaxID=3036245 RepID=A0ABQ6LIY5_9RHOB|nr:MucR family transcriptional regulator [Limibaculum sp. NKW23]